MFVQSQMHNKVMPRTFMSFNDLMSLFGQVLFLVKTPQCVRKNPSFPAQFQDSSGTWQCTQGFAGSPEIVCEPLPGKSGTLAGHVEC